MPRLKPRSPPSEEHLSYLSRLDGGGDLLTLSELAESTFRLHPFLSPHSLALEIEEMKVSKKRLFARSRRGNRRGFTLIELTMVILILAIVALGVIRPLLLLEQQEERGQGAMSG